MSDNAPPAKRMRLHTEKMFDSSYDKENICPDAKPEVRKRKMPKRKAEPKLSDLDSYVLLDVFDYLSVEGKFSYIQKSQQRIETQFRFRLIFLIEYPFFS